MLGWIGQWYDLEMLPNGIGCEEAPTGSRQGY